MFRILVVGAGYVGSEIAKHYRAKNQRVFALTKDSTRKEELEADGIETILADLMVPGGLAGKIPPAHFVIISLAPGESTGEGYRKLYLKGVANVLSAIGKNSRPRLVVYFSSTRVWGDHKGMWIDETVPPQPDGEKGEILLEAEKQILESGFPAVVFRLAGVYGPGRSRLRAFREKKWPERGRDRYLNMMHRDDIVGAMPFILNRGQEGSVYTGVDYEPVTQTEFCQWLAPKLGTRFDPNFFEIGVPLGKKCRNDKLRNLGFFYRFPSFRVGYEDLLAEDAF